MLGSRSIELKTKSIHLSPAYKLQINLLAALLCTHGPMLPSLRINYSSAQNGEHMLSELAWRRHCFP